MGNWTTPQLGLTHAETQCKPSPLLHHWITFDWIENIAGFSVQFIYINKIFHGYKILQYFVGMHQN
jgi:hypothetical protein